MKTSEVLQAVLTLEKYLDKKPMTNADRIRAMTDEELANMWCTYVDCGECPQRIGCSMNYQDCLKLALDYLKDVVQSDGE